MSNGPAVTFNISRTPGLEKPVWMEQTIHNKETNQSTVYLFQREAAKQTLWRCIKDYFKGIQSAGEQVEKRLCGTLHYNDSRFARMKITNPLELNKNNPSEVNKIIGRFERHIGLIGSKTFDYQPHASPDNNADQVHVKVDTTNDLDFKQRAANIIDSIQPDSKTITSSERKKIKKIAYYTADLIDDRARPKSEKEIKNMLNALDDIFNKIPKTDYNSRSYILQIKNLLADTSNKLRSTQY